jgi:hypothetical protein
LDTSNSASLKGKKKRRNFREWLSHAFATKDAAFALAPEDHALLDRVAKWLVGRRLTTPAELFLETFRPLGFLGNQAMIVASPVVGMTLDTFSGLQSILNPGDYKRFTVILERRENIDVLTDKISRCEGEYVREQKEEKENKNSEPAAKSGEQEK